MTLWSRISSGAFAVVLLFASSGHGPIQADTTPMHTVTGQHIALTGRCLDHLDAYRGAIAFLEKRLKRSPAAVTFQMKNGDRITLLNRLHRLMQLEKRVLISGFQSREQACKLALKG